MVKFKAFLGCLIVISFFAAGCASKPPVKDNSDKIKQEAAKADKALDKESEKHPDMGM